MSYVMVDVESDGPCPGLYSMVALGAVIVEPGLRRTFKGLLRPMTERYQPEALAVSNMTREQTMGFPEAKETMDAFERWLLNEAPRRRIFVSDNNGFDWQFVNYYFHAHVGYNPFGFSSQNLGSIFKGMMRDPFASFKHLRKTKHTHDPVDDAMGNAEALLTMRGMGFEFPT